MDVPGKENNLLYVSGNSTVKVVESQGRFSNGPNHPNSPELWRAVSSLLAFLLGSVLPLLLVPRRICLTVADTDVSPVPPISRVKY